MRHSSSATTCRRVVRAFAVTGTLLLACWPAGADPGPLWTQDGLPVGTAGAWHEPGGVVADGAGGVFVGLRSGDGGARVQHLDASGAKLWGDDGTRLSYSLTDLLQAPHLVADGQGGVFAGWIERRTGIGPRAFVQRLDSGGVRQWDAGGGDLDGLGLSFADYYESATFLRLVPDGTGGVVAVWIRRRGGSEIRAQRVSAGGSASWGAFGTPLYSTQQPMWSFEALPDGSGGALIAWQDLLLDGADADVRATRVDSTGALPAGWPAANVPLCLAPEMQHGVRMISDGATGAFVVWSQNASPYGDPPIRGQHLLGDGSLPWNAADGRELVGVANMTAYQDLVPDGAGGFLLAWQRGSGDGNDTQLLMQRFDAAGEPLWNQGNPLYLCNAPQTQTQVALAADGDGGAFAAWTDLRDGFWTQGDARVRMQQVASDGSLLWGPSDGGVVVSGDVANRAREPRVVRDGGDGAIAVWASLRDDLALSNVVAQRVAGSPGPAPVQQFLLPAKATLRLNSKRPERSALLLGAILDTGPEAADLEGGVTFRVGGKAYALPAFTAKRDGSFSSSAGGLLVAIRPRSAGSSRCPLAASLVGADAAALSRDGPLSFGIACGSVDTDCSIVLEKGKFAIDRGGLAEGATVVASAKATLAGPGKDSFTVTFLIAPSEAPSPVPDFVFSFGQNYSRTIPGARIRVKGRVLAFRDRTNALPSLTADLARGVVVVSGRRADLGVFPDGAQPVRLAVGPVGDEALIDVRMVRKGRSLTY